MNESAYKNLIAKLYKRIRRKIYAERVCVKCATKCALWVLDMNTWNKMKMSFLLLLLLWLFAISMCNFPCHGFHIHRFHTTAKWTHFQIHLMYCRLIFILFYLIHPPLYAIVVHLNCILIASTRNVVNLKSFLQVLLCFLKDLFFRIYYLDYRGLSVCLSSMCLSWFCVKIANCFLFI